MKTRSYLTAIILIVLVPLLALSAWGLYLLLDREKEARLLAVAEKTRSVALAIDQELASSEGALLVIAQTEPMLQEDFAALHALLRKTMTSPDSWAVLYDDKGRTLLHSHSPYGSVFDERPSDWVAKAIALQRPSVSNLRDGRAGKWKVVSVSVPVKTASGRQFLLSHTFQASHITELLHRKGVPGTWVIGVFGTDGITIARSLHERTYIGTPVRPELYAASQRQASGKLTNRTRDGFWSYTSFTHTSRAAWTVAIGAPIDEINRPARTATLVAAFILLSALGCAAAGIVLFARRVTGSFNLTLAAAKSLEVGAIPTVTRSGVVEADMLQHALRDAGIKLARENQARQALECEREKLLHSEREARQEAENQNHAKDEFLAMLAHELRNPLAPIAAAAQTLKLPIRNEHVLQRAGDVIVRQVEHLKALINDLLDVSRVTRGLVTIEREQVALAIVVSSAVEQVQPLIRSRNHTLQVHMRAPHALVLGDKTRLVQVLSNLLNNAAKYTPPEGEIALSVDVRDDEVEIKVTDNGIGIDRELLPHVFDLFRQAKRTPERSQGGLGLGLALVRSIMSLHGGRVEGHSEGPGRGSRFSLFLPLLPLLPPGKDRVALPEALPPVPTPPVHLMIVDDNVDAARALANLLETKGHQVTVAANASGALEHSRLRPLPLYILDIGLPDMDGYELCRRLRSAPGSRDATLVALTGYGQAQDIATAFAAGFDHHFVKPVNVEALDRILAAVSAKATSQAAGQM